MAEGYGVKVADKTLNIAVIGALAFIGYALWKPLQSAGQWGSDIGKAFNFGDPNNWLNQGFRTTGDWLSNVGSAIDLSDPRNPVQQAAAATGGWLSDVGSAFNFGSGDNWLNKAFTSFGDWGSDFGRAIDLTDAGKYDWLAGSNGILANTGNFLGDVGHGIDFTDENSFVRDNPVTDFIGWANPFD